MFISYHFTIYLKKFFSIILCILLFLLSNSVIGQVLSNEERQRNKIYNDNKKALVLIYNDTQEIQGSGLIYESSGKIITNYHVIHNGKKLSVRAMGYKEFTEVSIIEIDIDKDLALLKISAENLPTVHLAPLTRSSSGEYDTVFVGMDILAFGNPLTLPHSLTNGTISAIRKSEGTMDVKFHSGYEVFQINAETEKGSSGGALFNMNGDVIGITVAGFAGFNFAIPIYYAKMLINKAENSKAELSQVYYFPDVSNDFYYDQALHTREKKEIVDYVRVTGNIFDYKTKNPLSFASVSVIGISIFDETDAKGLFGLDIPKPESSFITLHLSANGYNPQQCKIDPENVPKSLQLYLNPKHNDGSLIRKLLFCLPSGGLYLEKRYKSGTLFLLMELLATSYGSLQYREYHSKFNNSLDDYNNKVDIYHQAITDNEINLAKQEMLEAHKNADENFSSLQKAYIAFISGGVIWGASILYASISGPSDGSELAQIKVDTPNWGIFPQITHHAVSLLTFYRF